MSNTLGLDDDLDGVELIRGLETAFCVGFSDREAEGCRTVGDIFMLLRIRLASGSDAGRRCVNAMAFYRLRRAYSEFGVEGRLSPSTSLKGFSRRSVKRHFKEIRRRAGLRVPRVGCTWLGQIGTALLVMSAAVLLVVAKWSPEWWLLPILVCGSGVVLHRFDPGTFPIDCPTLGDLARKVAALNYGRFVIEGAGSRDNELWTALLEVLSEHSTLPKTEIRMETLLLQSQLWAA